MAELKILVGQLRQIQTFEIAAEKREVLQSDPACIRLNASSPPSTGFRASRRALRSALLWFGRSCLFTKLDVLTIPGDRHSRFFLIRILCSLIRRISRPALPRESGDASTSVPRDRRETGGAGIGGGVPENVPGCARKVKG